jgi:hypothetical protein
MPCYDLIVTANISELLDRNKSNIKASGMSAPALSLQMLPGAERVLTEHRAEMPQKNELCGAFWVTLGLRAFADAHIEQDHVGEAASSLLSAVQTAESLPPGHQGRDDYVLDLPRVDDPQIDSGTSSEGLRVATSVLSDGSFAAVPISGEWTESNLSRVLRMLVESDIECLVMSNSATRFLWDSHTPSHTLFQFLCGETVEVAPSEWDVGHFLAIVGYIEGPGGTLAICADTYPNLGSQGIHLQPLAGVAASLRRDDSPFSGGILVLVPTSSVPVIEGVAEACGLTTLMWDNGTPYRPIEGAR